MQSYPGIAHDNQTILHQAASGSLNLMAFQVSGVVNWSDLEGSQEGLSNWLPLLLEQIDQSHSTGNYWIFVE